MRLSGCSDQEAPINPTLVVSTSSLQFSKSGGEQTLTVKSSEELTIVDDAAWVHTTLGQGIKGSDNQLITMVHIAVDPNNEPEERNSKLTVKSGSLTEMVSIEQAHADCLIVNKSLFTASPLGEIIHVEVTTTGCYSIAINQPWITLSDARATMDKMERFIVSPNPTNLLREGSISFTLEGITEVITIQQAGNSEMNMASDAMMLASKMFIGWNLGNSLEATNQDGTSALETMWGNPMVTKEFIAAVKAAGFNAVRIPCAWNGYLEDRTMHKIKESWLQRVEEVVNYCFENKMYAILNIHWDGGWLEENCTLEKQQENNEKQRALWTQIAMRFKDHGEYLLFAGTNEPNVDNATQMGVLLSYLQTFVNAVRDTGGNNLSRNLIVQGPSTDIGKTYQLMNTLPDDRVENRLMVEIHYYEPWQFTGLTQDESWGKMFYYWGEGYHFGDPLRDASWGEEAFAIERFALIKEQFIDKGVPVILGEYGATKRSLSNQAEQQAHEASRLYYLEFITREAIKAGLIPFYWDNGATESRIFDRSTGTITDQKTLNALMNGAN
ncbi:MAG: cellulase family glycosylhydrolase [Bacteroidota bacterium]|nr:cellulase family glycosylhydrolase [Bacteroidota bacterium]